MKGKSILFILIGIILIIVGVILLFGGNKTDNDTSNSNTTNTTEETTTPTVIARIFVYNDTGMNVINTVEITDTVKGQELEGFINQLHPLPENEIVDLALVRTVEIKYGNDTVVGIQSGEDRYCNYSLNGGGAYTMSYMPEGLVDWLKTNVL